MSSNCFGNVTRQNLRMIILLSNFVQKFLTQFILRVYNFMTFFKSSNCFWKCDDCDETTTKSLCDHIITKLSNDFLTQFM